MSAERPHRETDPIRRILVAFDALSPRFIDIDLLASLAARFRAKLEAVLVEDEEVLRVSDFPNLRQINLPTGRPDALDRRQLEKQLRSIAKETENAIAAASQRHRITWSFRIVRGTAVSEVVSASSKADLLILDRVSRSFMSHGTLASRLGAAADRVRLSVLLLHTEQLAGGYVVAVLSDPLLASKVLDLARPFIEPSRELLVVLSTQDAPRRQLVRAQADAWLRRRSLEATFHLLPTPGPRRLARALKTIGAGLVVVSADLVAQPGGESFLESLSIPVILVR